MSDERRFIAIPEWAPWREVIATSAEMAYSAVASDYIPSTPICILDPKNQTFIVYNRILDKS